tara:strand:- start:13567 stop:13830 length:264 start_codon:yes stop_codon:yes gene_type:complete
VKVFGAIEEHDASYDGATDMVHCKDVDVPALALLRAYHSNVDRNSVQTDLVMRKNPGRVQLGCFDVPNQEAELLIKNLKKVRRDERS